MFEVICFNKTHTHIHENKLNTFIDIDIDIRNTDTYYTFTYKNKINNIGILVFKENGRFQDAPSVYI